MLYSMTEVTQQVTNIIKVGGLKEVKEPFDFQFVFLGSSLSLEWQTTSCTSFPSNFMHIFPFPSLPYPEDFRSNAGHRSKSYINCLTSFNIDLLCMLSCFSCVQLFESRPLWTIAPPRGRSPWTVAHQAPLYMRILHARILERITMPSSRGSSRPMDQIHVSCIAGGFFTAEPPGKP